MDVNSRMSILEVKVENIENTLTKMENTQKENQNMTLFIKERLDKQNGLLPHLSEDMKVLLEKQDRLLSRINKDTVKMEGLSVKLRLLYGALTLGIGSLITHIVHHFLTK